MSTQLMLFNRQYVTMQCNDRVCEGISKTRRRVISNRMTLKTGITKLAGLPSDTYTLWFCIHHDDWF